MRYDETTRSYVEQRTAEERSKKEIIRCPMRYLVHQLYPIICQALRGKGPALAA